MSGPLTGTAAVPTGWRRLDMRSRFRRLGDSWVAILQIVVAASAAFAVAHNLLGHPAPLLAATVTVSSLGLVRDARPRRVAESVVGMLLGILVAELIHLTVGMGWWQLALALGVTLGVARLVSPQPGFAIAAGIQSIIVLVIATDQPFLRLEDGVIGGVAALLVTALIPRDPMRAEKRDGRALIDGFDSAATTLVQALRRGDRLRGERGLEKARGLQGAVDNWRTTLESGIAIARISPFLRRRRAELERHDRIRQALDYASRNLRVVARRAVYLIDDTQPRPVVADVLADLLRGLALIGVSLDDASREAEAREQIRLVAVRLDPRELLPGGSLGDHGLVSAIRPLAVDLLTATGLSPAEARALLPRL